MAFEKLSAEGISDKIMREANGGEVPPSVDMDQIDQLIRDILMEREAAERQAADRDLTPDEELSLYQQLEEEARTLTFQLKRLRSPQKAAAPAAEPEPAAPAEAAAPVPSAPAVSEPAAAPAEDPFFEPFPTVFDRFFTEKTPEAEPDVSEPSAATPAPSPAADFFAAPAETPVASDPPAETAADVPTEPELPEFEMPAQIPAAPTVLQPEQYRTYRKSRNQRMENFTLDPAAPPQKDEAVSDPEEPPMPEENEPDTAPGTDTTPPLEYDSADQKDTVRGFLCRKRRAGRLLRLLCFLLLISSVFLNTATAGEHQFTLLFGLQLPTALYLGLQFVLLLCVLLLSLPVFLGAIDSIRQHRPDKNRMLSLSLLLYLPVTGYLLFQTQSVTAGEVSLITPLALLVLFGAYAAQEQRFYTLRRNFDWLTGGKLTHAARVSEKLWSVQNVPVSFFDGYMAHGLSSDEGDRFSSIFSKVGMMLGFILMLVAYLASDSILLAVSMLPATLLLCTGVLPSMLTSLPLRDCMRSLRRYGCSTPSSADVKEYEEAISVCLNGASLFPAGSVSVRGIKSYQGKQIDLAIVDAASVLSQAKSLLRQVFLNVMSNNTELLKPVDDLVYEPLLGIAAWVDNKRVLIGNRQMMINHSIAIPKAEQAGGGLSHNENGDPVWTEIVYLSSQGQLCATFSVEMQGSEQAEAIIDLLRRYELTGYLYSMDACLTPNLLMTLFRADEGILQVMSATAAKQQAMDAAPLSHTPLQLATNGSDFALVLGIAACKQLYRCFALGKFLHSFSIGLGVLWTVITLLQAKPAWTLSLPLLILSACSGIAYWIYQRNQKF